MKKQIRNSNIRQKQLAQQQADDLIANMNAQMSAFNNALKKAFPEIAVANAVEPHSTSFFAIERRCRKCGCTDFSACYDKSYGGACYWVEEDLCSACATPAQKKKAMDEMKKSFTKIKTNARNKSKRN